MLGQTLGAFRIVEKLGQGGMGEVWLAEDTRLQRQVALKVLPAAFAADPERRGRFEREARAVAALEHPNIVTIHSIEESGGVHFLTMERVTGRPLTDLIPAGGMPLQRLLALAVQIADAVSAAHLQAITHRDIKPDNVMVTDDSRVKVLDFGLAKLHEEADAGARETQMPTVTHQTQEGVVLGTVAYMAPEQAEGRTADARSDVFALGVVLYEMATGRRPFEGDSQASLIASILRDTPASASDVNTQIPKHLARIIRICLAKEPLRRYQSAIDLRNELDELRREHESGSLEADAALEGLPLVKRAERGPWAIAAAAVAGAAITALVLLAMNRNGPTSSAGPVAVRFTQLTDAPGQENWPRISPDGLTLVYVKTPDERDDLNPNAQLDIFAQRVGGRRVVNLTETPDVSESAPAFSPDGNRIAYHRGATGGIFVMGATGESQKRVTDFGFHPSWSPDGSQIVFCSEELSNPGTRSSKSPLWVVDVVNGTVTKIQDEDAVQPEWSPNGRRIAYWAVAGANGERDIWTVAPDGHDPVAITKDVHTDWGPVWSPDGRYVYFLSDRGGPMNVWRVRIDEASGKASGAPEPVTAGVTTQMSNLSLTADGRSLAAQSTVTRANIVRGEFNSTRTRIEETTPVTRGNLTFAWPAVSPDGEWLAFSVAGSQEDLMVCRTDGSDLRRLTDDASRDRGPVWSPDNERIAFYSDRGGSYDIWSVRKDGSGLTQHTDTPGLSTLFPVWSPDGRRMVASYFIEHVSVVFDPNVAWQDQSADTLEGLVDGDAYFAPTEWSPDGRHLAGWILVSGAFRDNGAYDMQSRSVTRFGGAGNPVWSPDGRRLFFSSGVGFIEAGLSGGARREIALPPATGLAAGYDLSPDGRAVYFSKAEAEADVWLVELQP